MRILNSNFFGVISGILIGIILLLLSFIFKISFIYFEYLGKTPIYLGLIPLVLLFALALLNRKLTKSTLNWLYFVVALFNFIYFYSIFQWSVECCPNEYESMYDWNASKSLSIIVYLPLVFIITFIQGLTFDILRGGYLNK